MGLNDLEQLAIKSPSDLRQWLTRNHQQAHSIWLVTYKKHMGDIHVPWSQIVDEALCFGWIDSLPRKLDADRSMLLLSPRKSGSVWSAVNKAKVERLIAEGQMMPAGLEKVMAAKGDGRWSFLDDVDQLIKPDDLKAAFANSPPAERNFDGFPPSSRRGILEWIKQAKTPQTRAVRIAHTADLAANNVRPLAAKLK
jgi:uncharacterized protein YdeI (YjbR/CyaY-like superfamily)